MVLDFKNFVEVLGSDGYWKEVTVDNGFLSSYCDGYDGYITDELFIGLSCITDGYFDALFKQPLPLNLSGTVKYKLNMLSTLGTNKTYCLTLEQINAFNWDQLIYASFLTTATTFRDVAGDFIQYYLPSLNALGSPANVRLITWKVL